MAINKITNEQRELMRQKSAQSLPDVPSSKGWTPKNFKDAMTKPLFDNENSFFAFYNALVEQIENIKFDKDDYDFKNLGTFENERGFAQTCESDYYNSQREGKNFAYKGYITSNGNQSTALCLVGYTSGSGMNFDSMVISHKGITCYKQGYEVPIVMPKVEVSDLKVNMTTSVPYPTSTESATNKYYVDNFHYKKSDVDSKITDTKNYAYNLTGEAISAASSTAKHYYDESVAHTNAKFNEVKSVLDTILKDAPTAYDTLKEIADYIASDKTGASQMLTKINTNTLNIASLNMNKLGKNDKVPYENVVNAPETLDIILRSEVSADTTEEVKEMEINGMKFKVGSATSGDSAIKGKLVATGTLETTADSIIIYQLNNGLEKNKFYYIYRYDSENVLSYDCFCSTFEEDDRIILVGTPQIRATKTEDDSFTNGNLYYAPEDNRIIITYLDQIYKNEEDKLKIYELVAPVGSGSGGTSNRILTLSDVEYDFEDEDGVFTLYIYTKLNNQNLLIDFDKEFPDYQYKEIHEFAIFIKDCVNSQVLVKFDEMYVENLGETNEEVMININYNLRLTPMDTSNFGSYLNGSSTFEVDSYVSYFLCFVDGGTNIVKVDFDAFGNGTTYLSFNYEI